MEYQLKDERVALHYSPIFRSYSIDVIDWWIPVEEIQITKDLVAAEQNITYCPWCGAKLPENLRDKYFEILENEYGLDVDIFDIKNNPNIPEEFKSDEWWKKRGL